MRERRRHPAPPDEYEECPECGHADLETWVEKVEYGKPLNRHSRGAEAPKYRLKPVRFFECKREGCTWSKP